VTTAMNGQARGLLKRTIGPVDEDGCCTVTEEWDSSNPECPFAVISWGEVGGEWLRPVGPDLVITHSRRVPRDAV